MKYSSFCTLPGGPPAEGLQDPRRRASNSSKSEETLQAANGKLHGAKATAEAANRERCLAAGMDDFVSKPLRKEDHFGALDRVSVKGAEDNAETALYCREQLLSQCDGDESLMAELVSIFQDNTPRILLAIGEAVEKGDAPALATQAHKLLSSLGVFGAGRAQTLALRLQRHGRENDFGRAKERFMELERETHKIYAAFA
jgi:HPt (histidine-containing phosphotransfer) domain-containing protein